MTPPLTRYPTTATDRLLMEALIRCTFVPGSRPKRFASDIHQCEVVTARQRHYLYRLVYQYRRQIAQDVVLDAVRYMPGVLLKE